MVVAKRRTKRGAKKCKTTKRHHKSSRTTNGGIEHDNDKSIIVNGHGQMTIDENQQPPPNFVVAPTKKRVQLAASLSGNVYHLNELGCAELIEAPPSDVLVPHEYSLRHSPDDKRNSTPDAIYDTVNTILHDFGVYFACHLLFLYFYTKKSTFKHEILLLMK